MTLYQQIVKNLASRAKTEKKLVLQRFFMTGPGQYGEGDVFLGVVVPDQREVAKQYHQLTSLSIIEELLTSAIHEHRLTALLMLTYQFPKSDLIKKRAIYDFYLENTTNINNWDLVDLSAPNIVGEYMLTTKLDMPQLYRLVSSALLWERRIGIIATLAFIRAVRKQLVGHEWLQPSIELAVLLLGDSHDLMHKAVGWTLREVGKVDEPRLIEFLDQHHRQMPRTALRYSIERLNEKLRRKYLQK